MILEDSVGIRKGMRVIWKFWTLKLLPLSGFQISYDLYGSVFAVNSAFVNVFNQSATLSAGSSPSTLTLTVYLCRRSMATVSWVTRAQYLVSSVINVLLWMWERLYRFGVFSVESIVIANAHFWRNFLSAHHFHFYRLPLSGFDHNAVVANMFELGAHQRVHCGVFSPPHVVWIGFSVNVTQRSPCIEKVGCQFFKHGVLWGLTRQIADLCIKVKVLGEMRVGVGVLPPM